MNHLPRGRRARHEGSVSPAAAPAATLLLSRQRPVPRGVHRDRSRVVRSPAQPEAVVGLHGTDQVVRGGLSARR